MYNFCTLFDSYYIHKGIALYLSLEKHCVDFHLYVMAFDWESYDKLNSLKFEHMTVECMCDYETDFFLRLKKERNKAEYCWTCGPYVIHHFMIQNQLKSITYLDSDLFFIGDPAIAFAEIGDNSIAITEQGISEKNAKVFGKYCVQFMYFKNDKNGLPALEWWRDRCFEWCYQRLEDGKFGDQKYIDEFPLKFNRVHVIQNPGVGLAPWNLHRYSYCDNGNTIYHSGNTYNSVFFHMHGLKSIIDEKVLTMVSNDCFINDVDKRYFFNPYAELTVEILNNYFSKSIESYVIRGIPEWRHAEMYVRSKLNKIKILKDIYNLLIGKTEHNHGTKL